jgi:NTE family protein
MHLGLNLQTDFSAGSDYALVAEYRLTNLNRYGAEWRTTAELGGTRALTSAWYQPLDPADRFFVEPAVAVSDARRDAYLEGELAGVYGTISTLGALKTGVNFGTSSQLRLELKRGVLDAEPHSPGEGGALPVYAGVDLGAAAVAYEVDTFDNHNIPHRGTRFTASWDSSLTALGADDGYDRITVSYRAARTFRGRHTLRWGLGGGVTLDEDAPYYDEFTLGGLFKMSGLADAQLVGQNAASGLLLYYTRLGLRGIHVGFGVESGSTWDNRSEARFGDLRWGGTVFAAVDTLLGPIYLAYAYTEGEESGRLRFALGKVF